MINKIKNEHFLLALILIVTILKGITWSAIIPLWQAPDEFTHYSPIQFIAETMSLPGPRDIFMSNELCQSLTLLRVNDIVFNPINKQIFSPFLPNPVQTKMEALSDEARVTMAGQGCTSVGMHIPPFYYMVGALVYRFFFNGDFFSRAFGVRLLSVFLTTISVYFSWLITREVFPSRKALRLSVAVAVSFHPMMTFLGAVINTDSMLFCLGAILTYISVCIAVHGLDTKRAIYLGGVLGLGILTKPHIYAMLLPIGAALLISFWGQRKEWRRWILLLALIGIIALLVSGWGIIRSIRLNENALYASPDSEQWGFASGPNFEMSVFDFLGWYEKRIETQLFKSYWGNFGWLDTLLPDSIYILLRWSMIFAFFGLVIKITRYVEEKTWGNEHKAGMVVLMAAVSVVFLFAAYGYIHMRRYGLHHPSQGRYFMCPIAAQMILMVVGLVELFPKKFRPLSHTAFRVGFIGLNVLALFMVIVPRYYVMEGDPTPTIQNWVSVKDSGGWRQTGVLLWPLQNKEFDIKLWIRPDSEVKDVQVLVTETGSPNRQYESDIVPVQSQLFPLRLHMPEIKGNPLYITAFSPLSPGMVVDMYIPRDNMARSPVSIDYSSSTFREWWHSFSLSWKSYIQQASTILQRISQFKPFFFQKEWLVLLIGLFGLGIAGLVFCLVMDSGSEKPNFQWMSALAGAAIGILFLAAGFEIGLSTDWIDVPLREAAVLESSMESMIVYDLVLSSTDPATQIKNSKQMIEARWVTIDDVSQPVLWMHSPAYATYKIQIPKDAQLVFDMAMAPESWKLDYGDGVEFIVQVSDGNSDRTIFSEVVDPKHDPDMRAWLSRSVDLSTFAGQKISLRLETKPLENSVLDWSIWGAPKIVVQSK